MPLYLQNEPGRSIDIVHADDIFSLPQNQTVRTKTKELLWHFYSKCVRPETYHSGVRFWLDAWSWHRRLM